MSILSEIEKSPLSSKKFLALIISSLTSKLVLLFMITHAVSPAIIMWMVTCLMLIEIGFILGQSGLDAMVRLAHIKSISPPQPEQTEDKATDPGSIPKI